MSSKKGVGPKPWTISIKTCTDALVQGTVVSPQREAGWFEIDLADGGIGRILATDDRVLGFISRRQDGSFRVLVDGQTFSVTPLSGRFVRQQV